MSRYHLFLSIIIPYPSSQSPIITALYLSIFVFFSFLLLSYIYSSSFSPSHLTALFNRAFAYDKVGLIELAVADYSSALRLEPKNAFAYYNRFDGLPSFLLPSLISSYNMS